MNREMMRHRNDLPVLNITQEEYTLLAQDKVITLSLQPLQRTWNIHVGNVLSWESHPFLGKAIVEDVDNQWGTYDIRKIV